jgi:hypothetical protein
MTEIKQLTAQLYARLGVSSMPRSRIATLLEQIDLAAEALDALAARLAEAEARAERLSGAVIRLDGALAGEYGNPTRTPGEIEQDEWLELRPGDLSQQAEGRD